MATAPDDPHAGHTTEQIDALERAHALIDDAIAALGGEALDDFANQDIGEVWRHLRTAHLWLSEVLDAEGHGPDDGDATSMTTDGQPIH